MLRCILDGSVALGPTINLFCYCSVPASWYWLTSPKAAPPLDGNLSAASNVSNDVYGRIRIKRAGYPLNTEPDCSL